MQTLEAGEFERLWKDELHALADELLTGDANALERCVRFVCAETRGDWHNRARAMMCRRLKHLELPRAHRERLLDAIAGRLLAGRFTEQFRDQLRLALHLDAHKTFAAAERAVKSEREHVRRLARWVLEHRQAG